MFFKRGLVLAVIVLAGCRTKCTAASREWRMEDFQTAAYPMSASTNILRTVRDGVLHVVDRGTQPGDLGSMRRHWRASPEIGAAVEARVRVVSCIGMAGVSLTFADGVHEDILTLYTNKIELHHAKLSHAMDTTDDFHVYRVDIRGTNVSVLADGKKVIDGTGRFTQPAHEGRNYLSFGAGSSPATGEAYWDWVRWTDVSIRREPGEYDVPGARHTVVYKQAGRYACFPSLHMEPDTGYLYARFTAREKATHYGTPGMLSLTQESRDKGATWSEVSTKPKSPRSDMPASNYTVPDGALVRIGQNWRRWFPMARLDEFKGRYKITYSNASRGKKDTFAVNTGGFLERSEDKGRTWQRTEILGLDTYSSISSGWSNTQLPDGTVLRAFVVRHNEASSGKVVVVITRDGRTCEVVPVMGDPDNRLTFTEETRLYATSSGAVWMLTRVHGDGDFLWQAVSRDGGHTWTARKTEIETGQSPPSGLVKLDDGRLVLVFGYRKPPFGIRAVVSEDEGLTWRTDHVLVLRDDGEGFDLGYPGAVQLPGGDVLALYYYATDDQIRHIACTRFTVPKMKQK